MEYPDFIAIGKIGKSIGIKGEVKVLPLTDFPERFKKLKQVSLYNEIDGKFVENKAEGGFLFTISSATEQAGGIRLKLKDCDDRNSSERLKNLLIMVKETERVKLPEGQFYFYELAGCGVYENGIHRGEVTGVENYGSDDLVKVKLNDSKEILIPLRKEFIANVDIENKRVDAVNVDEFII